MEERKLSCDISPGIIGSAFKDGPVNKVLLTPDGKVVPSDKLKAMQDYARLLHKKFPHIKEARLSRKVAEHFKIKLV